MLCLFSQQQHVHGFIFFYCKQAGVLVSKKKLFSSSNMRTARFTFKVTEGHEQCVSLQAATEQMWLPKSYYIPAIISEPWASAEAKACMDSSLRPDLLCIQPHKTQIIWWHADASPAVLASLLQPVCGSIEHFLESSFYGSQNVVKFPSSGTFHRNTRAPLTMPFNVSPCQALPLLIRMSGTLCVWLRSSMEGWLKLGDGGRWGWGVAFLAIPWKKGCNHGSKPRGGLNYAWLHKAQSYQRAMSQQTQPHWASDPRKSPLERKKKKTQKK